MAGALDGSAPALVLTKRSVPSLHAFPGPLQLKLASTRPPFAPSRVSEGVLVVDHRGSLLDVETGSNHAASHVTAQYQLLLQAPGTEGAQEVRKSWNCCIPHDDGIIFALAASCNLLFAQLPVFEGDTCPACLFGSHAAEVTCLIRDDHFAISGAADGSTKLWALEDGQLLDTCSDASASKITAVALIGPVMVAVGTEAGHITTCDMSTRQLSPVQRFFVDHGPITALAAMVTFEQRGGVAASSAPRSQDGAGVVAGPMGLPWRLFPHAIGAQPEVPQPTFLAIASSTGWLHIYQPREAGENAWHRIYSGSHQGNPHMVFTPDGHFLVLASGAEFGEVLVLSTLTWTTAYQWSLPSYPVGVGLLGAGAELAVFPDTLAPAVRLTLYAAPARELPVTLQAKLALPVKSNASQPASNEPAEAEGFLRELRRISSPSQTTLPSQATRQRVLPATSVTLSPDRVAEAQAQAGAEFASQPDNIRQASALAYGLQQVDKSMAALPQPGAYPRPALRPSTQPVGRSWLTGGKAPDIDLSDVMERLQLQQGQHPQQQLNSSTQPAAGSGSITQLSAGSEAVPTAQPAEQQPLPQPHGRPGSPGGEGSPAQRAGPHWSTFGEQDAAAEELDGHDMYEAAPEPRALPSHITYVATTRGSISTVTPHPERAASPPHAAASRSASSSPIHSHQAHSPPAPHASGSSPAAHRTSTAVGGDSPSRQLVPHPYSQASSPSASLDSLAAAREHEFERTQYFGNRLVGLAGSPGAQSSGQSTQPAEYVAGGGDQGGGPVPGSPAHSHSTATGYSPPRVGTRPGTAAGRQQDEGQHQQLQQVDVTGDGSGAVEAWARHIDEYQISDFVSVPASRPAAAQGQQEEPLGSSGASADHQSGRGGTRLVSSQQLASHSRVHTLAADSRPFSLRAPRASAGNRGKMSIASGVGTQQQGQGQDGAGVGGGEALQGAQAPVPHRSPFRGYKPNTATLLKELRQRGKAAQKAAAVNQAPLPAEPPAQRLPSHTPAAVLTPPRSQLQEGALQATPVSPVLMGSPASFIMASQRQQQQPPQQQVPGARDGAASPLQQPTIHGTLGLLKKLEVLSTVPAPAMKGIEPAQQEEFARMAAAAVTNVPPHVHLYHDLQAINGILQQKPVQKQLHPGWVASRQLKPEIGGMWSAADQQRGVSSTRGVALYTRPSPQEVAASVLSTY